MLYVLVISLTLQLFCVSALGAEVSSLNGHKGFILKKENIAGDNQKFKLSVYVYGDSFNFTSLRFTYNGTKISPWDIHAKSILKSDNITSAMEMATQNVDVGTKSITDETYGWAMLAAPTLELNTKTIQIDTTLGMQDQNSKSKMGIVDAKMPLKSTERYLLYSIYFKADGGVTSDQIYSSDFVMKPTQGTNETGTLVGSAVERIFHMDVYFEGFSSKGQPIPNPNPTIETKPTTGTPKPTTGTPKPTTGTAVANNAQTSLPNIAFADVQNHWAQKEIDYMISKGIVKGIDEKSFFPEKQVTRAEFVTILARMAKVDMIKYSGSKFADVKTEDWFAPYVAWASEAGVTSGMSKDAFAPNARITREQMAVMIDRFANVGQFKLEQKTPVKVFADSGNISSYATESILKVQQAGVINGNNENNFVPQNNATRAEATAMLGRLLKSILGE